MRKERTQRLTDLLRESKLNENPVQDIYQLKMAQKNYEKYLQSTIRELTEINRDMKYTIKMLETGESPWAQNAPRGGAFSNKQILSAMQRTFSMEDKNNAVNKLLNSLKLFSTFLNQHTK